MSIEHFQQLRRLAFILKGSHRKYNMFSSWNSLPTDNNLLILKIVFSEVIFSTCSQQINFKYVW